MIPRTAKNMTVTVTCQFVLSSDSEQIACKQFDERIFNAQNPDYGFGSIISHEKLKENLKKDQLKISATVTLHGKDKQGSSNYSIGNVLEGHDATREVVENLWLAYQDKIFSDFTLISNDKKAFPCHKIVLASQSPVMQKMLNSGMKEATKQKLEIKDYDSELLAAI
eukprot:GFUD01086610.1.p1 GENE.GFUD01086610.1~~GFUD01086610.1.p1  ORF type:complete len:167 (-),score=45.92 GFUD01086610.1:461-961(-)